MKKFFLIIILLISSLAYSQDQTDVVKGRVQSETSESILQNKFRKRDDLFTHPSVVYHVKKMDRLTNKLTNRQNNRPTNRPKDRPTNTMIA